jgi:hypothetical protein
MSWPLATYEKTKFNNFFMKFTLASSHISSTKNQA